MAKTLVDETSTKALTNTIYSTENYDAFIKMPGNRRVDKVHVKSLIRRMTESGNLTQIFPIVVNHKMELIDGQHRLAALQELGWPVFFEVKEDLNIDSVRSLNNGHRNWSWRDYADSSANLGNDNYVRFLNLIDHFKLPFGFTLALCDAGNTTSGKNQGAHARFREGDFKMVEQDKVFKQLKMLSELIEVSEHNNRPFVYACRHIFRNEDYDHARMLRKLEQYGPGLKKFGLVQDYLRSLEDIYNKDYAESARVRLF